MISEIEKKSLRRGSAKRRFFLFLRHSFVWVLGGVLLLWLSSYFLIASVAEQKLSELSGGAAYVQSGRLKLSGAVRLKGVAIAADRASLAARPIVQADEIEVRLNLWKLLRGKFHIDSVALDDFLLTSDYYPDKRQWNFQALFQRPADSQDSSSLPGKIPFVTIDNGIVQVSRFEKDKLQMVTTIGFNGQLAAQRADLQYSFSLRADDRFGFGGSVLEGVFKPSVENKRALLSLEGRVDMGETVLFENAWNVEQFRMACEFDQREIELQRCAFSLGDGQGSIVGSLKSLADGNRELNAQLDFQNLKLSHQHQPNAFVYSEEVLGWLGAGAGKFLNRYRPAGTGDVKLSIEGVWGQLGDAIVNGTVTCRDISILNANFPYEVEGITGEIAIADSDLELKNLAGTHGDVDVTVEGTVKDNGPNSDVDIRVASPNMRFDNDLKTALNESLQKVWFSFVPSGRTGLAYRYTRSPKGEKTETLTMELKNAGMVYDHFPYPLENLTGTITYESDAVAFKNLLAHYEDGRSVALNGQVLELRSGRPNFKIHVDAKQIPVNEMLINAMPEDSRRFFNELEIDGLADIDVDVFRNETGKRLLDVIAKVTLDGKRLVYENFNVPMSDVHLSAVITHDLVDLKKLKAAVDGGTIAMKGQIRPEGTEPGRPDLNLDVDFKRFDLNETFWAAAGADANELLGNLRLQGRVDAKGHLVINSATGKKTDLTIRCDDNPVLWVGQELCRADGTLRLASDKVFFSELQLKDIALESLPKELLSEKTDAIYKVLEPHGKVSIFLKDGFIQTGPKGIRKIDVIGGLDLQEIACGSRQRLDRLTGQVNGTFEADFQAGQCEVMARYDIRQFYWKDYLVNNLQGQLAYDPATSLFTSQQFSANLYDGLVTGDVDIDFGDDDKAAYQFSLSLDGAAVKDLLVVEYTSALENVMEGLASGRLYLEGDFKQLADSRGKVSVSVKDIKLGKQSLMGKVLTAMQLRTPKEFVFNEIEIKAFIQGRMLIIESARMVGDPMIFRGSGTLNLDTQEISMEMVGFDRLMGKEDTILDQLARGIGKALWKVELRGTVEEPKIEAVFFSVLKQPLDIFKKKKQEQP